MTPSSNWTDLRTRSLSGVILAAVGLALIFAGGLWFAALAVVVAGLMLWELAAMMGAGTFRARIIGALGTLCSAFALLHLLPWAGLTLLVPLILGAGFVRREGIVVFIYGGAILVAYGGAILVAAYVGVSFLTVFGPLWLIWLICVVVATDVFGYFAGRLIGGPKFWPSISPKKTWSGTVAGWVASALVGLIFVWTTSATSSLILISVVVAFASQLGDIAESAIKRRMGENDSSHLIPGHGGLLDRFDGLMGAILAMLVITEVVMVPVITLAGH